MTAAPRDLEAVLRAAAADVAWPATPDLRSGVVARIAAVEAGTADGAGTDRAARPAREPLAPAGRRRTLVRALVVALLALLALAGIAAALGFRIPGLDIVLVERLPATSPVAGQPVASLEVVPGVAVPLAEARDGEPPRVLVPAALREPAVAFVDGAGEARFVTLAWQAAPGGPTIEGTDLALVLTAATGSIEVPMLGKALGPGSTIEPVSVNGDPGWWIAGMRHELFVLGPGGDPLLLRSRLAGDTLVFARDGTVYRLESALGRDATVEIAESLR